MLVDYLKADHPHIKRLIYFYDGCGGQYKNYNNFMDLCSHKHHFGISAEWVFFATSYCKSPCDKRQATNDKRHVAKRSLQRSLNNQILNYKAMLDLCVNEMMSIKFFGIFKKSMISVENLEKSY